MPSIHPINAVVKQAIARTAHLEPRFAAAYHRPIRDLARMAERNFRRHVHTDADGRPLALPDIDEVMPVADAEALFGGVGDDLRRRVVSDVVSQVTRGARSAGLVAAVQADAPTSNPPFAQQVLDLLALQVTNISESTRRQIMATITAGYDAGSSAQEIARALTQVDAVDLPRWRSEMIARTEMSQAVNASTLATVRQTRAAGYKTWLTAPGAPHPRHELYDSLDGQTVSLDEAFTVGGYPADHPSDPQLPPEESINCRCDMLFGDDDAGGDTGHSDAFNGIQGR